VDLDDEVERSAGASVAAIIEREGLTAFRDREARALERAIGDARAEGPTGVVVACGGGVLGRSENRVLLSRRAFVVWLRVSPEVAADRLKGAGTASRPLLAGAPAVERLQGLLVERARSYEEAADVVVDTGGLAPAAVAAAVAEAWKARGGGAWAPSGS